MKTKLLSLTFLICSYLSFSHTTAIPDTNFEQALIDFGIDSDGTINGQILTIDALSIPGEPILDVSNRNISDLTGIEAFTNLPSLICNGNQITSLDLSNNPDLIELNCSNNQLTSLNIKNGNSNNLLPFLFYANNNPNLSCIQVDDPNFATTNFTNVDQGVTFSTNCISSNLTTAIPDANFEQALIDLGIDSDGILNGEILTSDISGVTSLNVSFQNINDLSGIEDFIALTELKCNSNQLASLNIDNNLQLKKLLCYSNNLSSLNISNNTLLEEVNCNSNSIQSINLTNNTLLKEFQISGSQLTSIDVSNNNLLEILSCGANQITSLDVSNNPNLKALDCYFNQISSLDISNNLQLITLTCGLNNLSSLNVSNHTFLEELSLHDNSIQNIDISNNTQLKILIIDSNQLTSLDISNNILLEELSCQDNQLTYLNVNAHVNLKELLFAVNQISTINISNNTLLETFHCQLNQLNSLDVSNNNLLKDLNCGVNSLTSLDVSQNTLLEFLWCSNNQLANLDLSNNLQMNWLNCSGNQLSSLDLSSHSMLQSLECNDNQLKYLNLKNINNTAFVGENYFFATNNPNLTCIEVDDVVYSTTNWTNIDPQTSFSTDCGIAWVSNSDDYANFTATDSDNDTFTWKTQNGNVSAKGLVSGTSFFSESYDVTNGALTPDNLLITPAGEITIPTNVSSINFKLNVEASNATRPAENFAIYVFDEAIGQSFNNKIYEETLTVGGTGTAKDIIATIPPSFAGKDIGIIVRHYNCTGQDKLFVDDFEVSYQSNSLSTETTINNVLAVYPNPTQDYVNINIVSSTAFKLLNINGQILKEGLLINGKNTINLSDFKSGLYFLNLKTDSGIIIKKIIKN